MHYFKSAFFPKRHFFGTQAQKIMREKLLILFPLFVCLYVCLFHDLTLVISSLIFTYDASGEHLEHALTERLSANFDNRTNCT